MFLKGLRMLPVRLLARRVMPVKEENIKSVSVIKNKDTLFSYS